MTVSASSTDPNLQNLTHTTRTTAGSCYGTELDAPRGASGCANVGDEALSEVHVNWILTARSQGRMSLVFHDRSVVRPTPLTGQEAERFAAAPRCTRAFHLPCETETSGTGKATKNKQIEK